jgi:hypothetical protein
MLASGRTQHCNPPYALEAHLPFLPFLDVIEGDIEHFAVIV